MDLTRLKTLAGLNEGRMKHHIEDIASTMELEDFLASAPDFGMGEEEATEFWQSVNGMDEASTVNGRDTSNDNNWKQTSMSPEEAKQKGYEVRVSKGALRNGDDMVEVRNKVNEGPNDYPNVVSTKPGDGDYEKGFMYFDKVTGELYKTHPGYEVKSSYDDFVAGRDVDTENPFQDADDIDALVGMGGNPDDPDADWGAVPSKFMKNESSGESLNPELKAMADKILSGEAQLQPETIEDVVDYIESVSDMPFGIEDTEALEQYLQSNGMEFKSMDEAILPYDQFVAGRGEKRSVPNNLQIYTDYKEAEATGDADPYQYVLDKYPFLTPEKLDMILGDLDESVDEYTLEAVDVEEEEELTEAPTMDTTQLVNLMRNSGLSEEAIQNKLDEWANTPEGVGEVEPTSHGDAYDHSQPVNLSLKKYLGAQDMKVQVSESYTGAALMEAYKAYKGEVTEAEEVDEANVKEGNAYTKALADAKAAGKKKFTVDGKEYTVESKDEEETEEVNESDDAADIARLRRLSGL